MNLEHQKYVVILIDQLSAVRLMKHKKSESRNGKKHVGGSKENLHFENQTVIHYNVHLVLSLTVDEDDSKVS